MVRANDSPTLDLPRPDPATGTSNSRLPKKLKQRRNVQRLRQPFQGIFIPRQCMAIDEDVETWVFPFNDDVKAGSHRSEHSGGGVVHDRKFPSGNPKD